MVDGTWDLMIDHTNRYIATRLGRLFDIANGFVVGHRQALHHFMSKVTMLGTV
jgi:hypothetical protein